MSPCTSRGHRAKEEEEEEEGEGDNQKRPQFIVRGVLSKEPLNAEPFRARRVSFLRHPLTS